MTNIELLAVILEHLTTFDLPEPWSVKVSAYAGERDRILVQLRGSALPHAASTLLAWSDTLTDVSTEVWRVPGGYSVHLSVEGRMADGTTVAVFDGVEPHTRFGLEPDERRPVSLACLREWSTLNEGVAA
ncbi:hypothetical protein [Actinocrispum sp. NPDC049592]|uniref:hypothetical protein n=1 Tax=Actinocrispum sp. NPDC049592 TaxID=3154835 RepID=UPI003431CE3F